MAAVQLKHTNSSDILFPDDAPAALDDSFYSQPSTSNYSTYSQEVKFIFSPGTTPRNSRGQNDGVEIQHASSRSSANSVEVMIDGPTEPRRTVCSSASPRGVAANQKLGYLTARSLSSTSSEPSASDQRYGSRGSHDLTTTDQRYGPKATHEFQASNQRYGLRGMRDNQAPEQRYGLGVKAYSCTSSEDPPQVKYPQQPGVNLDSGRQAASVDSGNGVPHSTQRPPPYISSVSHKFPPRNGPLPTPQTPPKPKRLHQLNNVIPCQDFRVAGPFEIYSMPAAHSPGSKTHLDKDLPPPPLPPPPPQCPPPSSHKPLSDFQTFAARRRTWSPPTFSRVLNQAGTSQLQAMRCYRSNEQLDQLDTGSSENMYEELDDISRAVAPPRITPQSGKLNKFTNERIIKPIACKPVMNSQSRYTPQRPSPPACQGPSPPSCAGPSPLTAGHTQTSPLSPPRHTSDQTCQLTPQSASRGADGPSDSHLHTTGAGAYPRSQNIMIQSASAVLDWSVSRPPNSQPSSSHPPSHLNGQPKNSAMIASFPSDGYGVRMSSKPQSSGSVDASLSLTTPSPSDSGVVEVEAILRGKDAEIAQLRDTMEKNEKAILQVCEEKRQNWQMELQETAEEWQHRLRAQQQKSFKSEQSLLMQLFQLQQERKALRQDVEQLRGARDKADRQVTDLTQELDVARRDVDTARSDNTRLQKLLDEMTSDSAALNVEIKQLASNRDEVTKQRDQLAKEKVQIQSKFHDMDWELKSKTDEIGLLKSQVSVALDDCSGRNADVKALRTRLSQEQDLRSSEVDHLRKENMESQKTIFDLRGEVASLKMKADEASQVSQSQTDTSNNNQHQNITLLETELCKLRTELGMLKTAHHQEKEQWLEEKNKVVRYQKHLQLNYVQMMRKNKLLEAEIEQLTLELENRDIKLMSDGVPGTEEESVC